MPPQMETIEREVSGRSDVGKDAEISYPVLDDEDEAAPYKQSVSEKLLNYLFCRGDLANEELETRPVSIFSLFRFGTTADHFMLFIGILCAILSGISQPVLALISGRITNVLLLYPPNSTEFRKEGYQNVYIFLGVGAITAIINFLQYMCFHTLCTRIIAQMRHRYLKSILRQNAAWFDKNHSGALTTKLSENIERIRDGIGDKLGLLIRGIAMLIAAIVISFIYEWRLALMMLGIAPAGCFTMSMMARKMTSTTIKELDGVGRGGAIAEESLMGVKTVQALNGQQTMVDRYSAELLNGKTFAIWKGFWSGFYDGLFFFILYAFLACGGLYGGYLLKVGIMTKPGDVLIVVLSMLLGAYFLGMISPHLMVLLNARVAAATIYQTIERVPRIDVYSANGLKPSKVTGRVVFKNVHFRYPSRKEAKVLNGLNLVIEPGQTVALVGHSGCGKSTSVGLLTRLYEPEGGKVMLDGVDVRELNIDWLRSTIGIVQQEPILFNETIEENLSYGNPEISQEQMIHVCKMANAHDFVMKLPQGYKTVIGDGGVQLSGGQKQRIAIARTLARDPRVLLLDEATSALDAQSESIVQEALNNASKGRSTIIIAHRLSTVREADKIVVFEKGVIVEEGSHDQLVEMKGRYYDLVKAQQFQPEENENNDEMDSLSRSSTMTRGSGREAFIRASKNTSSFGRMSRRSTALSIQSVQKDGSPKEKQEEFNAGYMDIFKNAQGNYLYMLLGIVCALIRGLELPAVALIFTYVFEAFQFTPYGSNMMHRLAISVNIYCATALGIFLTQTLGSVFFAIVSENLTMRFRVQAFKNLLYQDAGYFDNPAHTPGKLIMRLATDAPAIKAVIDGRAMIALYAISAMIGCIVIGFINCWQVAILGTGLLFILAGSMIWLASAIMKEHAVIAENDDAGRIAIETIENVRTIQLLTRCTKFYERFEFASKQQKYSELKKGIYEALNFSVSQTFMYIMMTATYAVGIDIIYKELGDADVVFRGINAFVMCTEAVMNSAAYFPEFVSAKSAAGLLFSMIYKKPKTGDADEGDMHEIRGNIMFDGVRFAYPERASNSVMRGLQFSAQRGQTVALVGPSGSGKSTCISMLERFYDTTGGFVRFDGKDLKTLNLTHLRTQMALVGQEPRLFAGTIKDNICFGLDEVPMQKIEHALELANCKRFLSNLPQGIETEVGERGTQLSGGQKQRIAIARALVRDPKILLLDEATSALDSESERAVQEALDKAREGRTCITIAHRLSSIQNADLIVYIEDGKVRESGTHSTLMQHKGRYFELIKKQSLST